MSEVTYRQAINAALDAELAADPDVFLLGEDIGAGGGVFKVTDGLFAKYGAQRVFDTPISEQAILGCALGAAMQGLRPVAEIMFADFVAVCFDQIVNQIAKYRYMTDAQVAVPLTIRMASGAGGGFAAQHSQSAEQWLLNVPGLKLVVPSTPSDAYWMLRAAIRDPDPVLYFEHKFLYGKKGRDRRTCDDAGARIGRGRAAGHGRHHRRKPAHAALRARCCERTRRGKHFCRSARSASPAAGRRVGDPCERGTHPAFADGAGSAGAGQLERISRCASRGRRPGAVVGAAGASDRRRHAGSLRRGARGSVPAKHSADRGRCEEACGLIPEARNFSEKQ